MNGIVPYTQIRIQIQKQAPQEIQSHTKQTVKLRSIPPHQNLALPRIDTHNPTRNAHSTATPEQRHQIL